MKLFRVTLTLSLLISCHAAAKVEEFIEPRVEGLRMDVCLSWSKKGSCGKSAAHEWCLQKGYTQVIHWEVDSNVGIKIPTKLLLSKEICNKETCDAFKVIVCYSG